MSQGAYGVVRPATFSSTDAEVFYTFQANRDVVDAPEIISLDAEQVLVPITHSDNTAGDTSEVFGGLYDLRLPADTFNAKGFYNVLIRPKENRLTITDCGVLSSQPDIKGIVLDVTQLPGDLVGNGSLVGYRIEYISEEDGVSKVNNLFRIITSSNRCEAVNQNLANSSQKDIRYRFTDAGTLLFLTLTPSSAPSVKPTATPFIGSPGQKIIITNTFFNPVTVEVEMVEHDIETLAYSLYGNQTKSIQDGVYTIYNFENQIYRQYNLFEVKDDFNNPLFEVKEEKTNIDFSKEFDIIVAGI